MLFACLLGCAHPNRSPSWERVTELGVPLDSEEGRIKLAVLAYVSNDTLKSSLMPRLVPFTEAQLQMVTPQFRCEIRPAARAGYDNRQGIIDTKMDTKALLLLVGNPRFKGGNASVIGGYQRYGMTLFEFVLAHGAIG
jgi:hypothetical protein